VRAETHTHIRHSGNPIRQEGSDTMVHTSGRRMSLAAATLVLALVAAACGSSSKSNSSDTTGGSNTTAAVPAATLNGSGSTFQQPYDQAAIQAFTSVHSGVTINYAGGGSGKGQTDLQGKLVDFAGTDALPKSEDLSKYTGGALLYFPFVAAPITVSYNLSGVDNLQLSADTIAKIFQRQIKTWNDPAIKADNPSATLPSTDITVVHRSDASGTTNNFTLYLKTAAPNVWTLGSDKTVNWPSDTQAGNGNPGVANAVKATNGAIGYVDYSDAKASGLNFAAVKNKAGKYVKASLDATSAAIEGATAAPDLSYNPMDAPGDASYPIAGPTWIMVYKNQTDHAKGTVLKAFLTFILSPDGQDLAATADFAKLPSSLLTKAQAQLDQITVP
jgi:phosphate transport system substrate-binding protein